MGRGKASVGFDSDWIRTLVSMATDSSYRVTMGKTASSHFLNVFYQTLFILAGNDDMHDSLNEFEIWPDSTTYYRVNCLKRMKKSHRLIIGKTMSSQFLRYLYWLLFIFAVNEGMHQSLDEFEIRPDATTDFHGNRWGYSGKNAAITFPRTFFNGFISYLQVIMIYIRA